MLAQTHMRNAVEWLPSVETVSARRTLTIRDCRWNESHASCSCPGPCPRPVHGPMRVCRRKYSSSSKTAASCQRWSRLWHDARFRRSSQPRFRSALSAGHPRPDPQLRRPVQVGRPLIASAMNHSAALRRRASCAKGGRESCLGSHQRSIAALMFTMAKTNRVGSHATTATATAAASLSAAFGIIISGWTARVAESCRIAHLHALGVHRIPRNVAGDDLRALLEDLMVLVRCLG